MLRVAEQYAGTDTGLQRRANEDSLLARAPLFVVADGMGGAQAGEVASKVAVECFHAGLCDGDGDGEGAERALAAHAHAANARIHTLSRENAEQAGMGTTLTAVYVGEREVAIAHVGDSRAYCLRDGELLRLTDDHSLVDELIREGRLTPEEAEEHPQRSIITRALGPEETVDVDTRSFGARAGDIYLLCSDGLTSMVPEARLAELLRTHAGAPLRDTGELLIAEANRAGGRDNITVILLRLEDVASDRSPAPDPGRAATAAEHTTLVVPGGAPPATAGRVTRTPAALQAPAVAVRHPRAPVAAAANGRPRKRARRRRVLGTLVALGIVGLIVAGGYVAMQSVYFLGTNARGLVTMYRGLPYQLPGGIRLYSSFYVSGVSAATLSPGHRATVLDHKWRSEKEAGALVRSVELEELAQ